MPDPVVHYEAADGVALLTLDAPPANCYSHPLMRSLDEAILRARFDDEVEVIVITGKGERFFCAGADIEMLGSVTERFKYHFCLHANETLLRLEHTEKLVIAAINGHCVGGGYEIALACDLRFARVGAGKIGLPEVKLGVLPGTGGTQRLSRLLGPHRALRMMIDAATLDPADALREGLIDRVIDSPTAEFLPEVLRFARSYASPDRASLAVGLMKRAVVTGSALPLESGLAFERELQARLFGSHDGKEGIAAYSEKRAARFAGR